MKKADTIVWHRLLAGVKVLYHRRDSFGAVGTTGWKPGLHLFNGLFGRIDHENRPAHKKARKTAGISLGPPGLEPGTF